MHNLTHLLTDIRACAICSEHLPLGPRPVIQAHPSARILIAGQAPGRKVHETGIPFNDASGDRLRAWLGISRDVFYDATRIAIVPMGFCYPGTGKSGDLPPRQECADTWRAQVLENLHHIQLTLVIGRYAQAYHLPDELGTLTDTVKKWQKHWPHTVLLPHPSPRNNRWLKHNPWFEKAVLPLIQDRISEVLTH